MCLHPRNKYVKIIIAQNMEDQYKSNKNMTVQKISKRGEP